MAALALAVVPKAEPTLYALEENLLALLDTADTISPEQETEFVTELQTALVAAVEKRDRIGQFLAHLEAQAAFAAAEIKRLQERKKVYERTAERIEQYVIAVIDALGPDAKGRPRKLEGHTVTFTVRCCPSSVEILDEAAIPSEYKTVTVTLPALQWEAVLDGLDLETGAEVLDSIKRSDISVRKSHIKTALESGVRVPGAALVTDGKFLVRK